MERYLSKKNSLLNSIERVLQTLLQQYDALDNPPDSQAVTEYEKALNEYAQALLGVEISCLEYQAAIISQEILEEARQMLSKKAYKNQLAETNERKVSAGDALWDHTDKKARFDDTGVISLLKRGSQEARFVGQSLLAIYRAFDSTKTKPDKRPNNWRRDALQYYKAEITEGGWKKVWAHDVGGYCNPLIIVAAHIVPHFFISRFGNLGTDIFGSRGNELHTPSNSLLLSCEVKRWLDKYSLVIVPVDYNETPITRWKVELLDDGIRDQPLYDPNTTAGDLEKKELLFTSKARPASRFLYFNFIMALVRIRDMEAPYWRQVWARYLTRPPFPTPGNYLRQSMLIAINQHFKTTDVKLIENWIKGQGFERPITLSEEDAKLVAKRIQIAVDQAKREVQDCENEDNKYEGLVDLYHTNRDSGYGGSDSDGDSNEKSEQ
ncbi:hypothetical protein O1611_g7568 [Lasiodiplodia mahajangana]|uniref:Uncharacterized protein n=1 Tax=Lasiodiplodia mahajangana TaxID=1108764 RepID=A0ACC2JF67_9PEZI|nr:hypothetical protein O1611_g7568 [Lasiodiplodia mahajangana]